MGKLASKVSPYLKNGISKVLSKASSGAKKILSKVSGKLDDVLGAFSKTSKELFYKAANKADDVIRGIKNSAQDLVDRLSGKFNQITSKIDDKIDDALRSMAGKADDALNSLNELRDRLGYNIRKSLGLQEEYAGIGDMYIPPEKSDFFKDNVNKIISNKNGGATVNNIVENKEPSTEDWYKYLKEKYGEDNVYLCTDEKSLINSVSEKLEKYRLTVKDGANGTAYKKTAIAYGKNLDTVSIATSNSHEYNPTILIDAEKFDNNVFERLLKECDGVESAAYSKYYKNTLTEDYIKDSISDEYFINKGLSKDEVIAEMKKLTDAIDNTKKAAQSYNGGQYSIEGEPSFETWNVENCAEVWSTRKAILNGAKFDEISFKCVETSSGNYAKPCKNCKVTFGKLNNVGAIK